MIHDGEMNINRFFKANGELAKFRARKLDKDDDHPSIYYTSFFL